MGGRGERENKWEVKINVEGGVRKTCGGEHVPIPTGLLVRKLASSRNDRHHQTAVG